MTWPNAAEILPDDADRGDPGRPRLGPGRRRPERRRAARRRASSTSRRTFPTMRALTESADPRGRDRCGGIRHAPRHPRRARREHAARDPRRPAPVAALADRPAGREGRRRDVPGLDARARHRGARPRRPGCRRGDPRRDPRRRSAARSTTLRPGSPEAMAAQGAAHRARLVEPVPRGRHRPRRRGLHQGAGARHRRAGVDVGVHPASQWNNPEPEVVLVVASDGRIVGATLGNDVNLRDIEGRCALLLGKAKDNNAVGVGRAVHPPVRRRLRPRRRCAPSVVTPVDRRATTASGSTASASSRASAATPPTSSPRSSARHHQYPDGFVLYLGTMFAPVEDRDVPGRGFTHHDGDLVSIAEPRLGALVNRVRSTEDAEPWTFGIDALYRSLTARGLLR